MYQEQVIGRSIYVQNGDMSERRQHFVFKNCEC